MSCTTILKSGQRCGQRCGNDDKEPGLWCAAHAKKMIKYYKKYKVLEETFKSVENGTIKLASLSYEELKSLMDRLIKVYHYRSVLRQQFYPDYQDEGHTQRLEVILTLIKDTSLEASRSNGSCVSLQIPLLEPPSKSRPAQPTSVKQVRKAKEKHYTPQMMSHYDPQAYDGIVMNMYRDYAASLYNIVSFYFTRRYGNELGLTMLKLSIAFASSIVRIRYTNKISDPYFGRITKVSIYQPATQEFSAGFCIPYNIDDLHESVLGNLKNGIQVPDLSLYVLFIIINSYHININSLISSIRIESPGTILVPWLRGVSYTNDSHTRTREEEIKALVEMTKGLRDKRVFSQYAKKRLAYWPTIQKGFSRRMPQIDIDFCYGVATAFPVNGWKIVFLGDMKYVFHSPLLRSSIVDLKNTRNLNEFYHNCITDATVLERELSVYADDKNNAGDIFDVVAFDRTYVSDFSSFIMVDTKEEIKSNITPINKSGPGVTMPQDISDFLAQVKAMAKSHSIPFVFNDMDMDGNVTSSSSS